jgi:hypothetical protein
MLPTPGQRHREIRPMPQTGQELSGQYANTRLGQPRLWRRTMYPPASNDEITGIVSYLDLLLGAIRAAAVGLTDEQARLRPCRSAVARLTNPDAPPRARRVRRDPRRLHRSDRSHGSDGGDDRAAAVSVPIRRQHMQPIAMALNSSPRDSSCFLGHRDPRWPAANPGCSPTAGVGPSSKAFGCWLRSWRRS